MKNNLLVFGFVFFFTFSIILTLRIILNAKSIEGRKIETSQSHFNFSRWLQEIPINLPKNVSVLIIGSDDNGCNLCLYEEIQDWQKWLKKDSINNVNKIFLLLETSRPKRAIRELEVAGITYSILIDSTKIAKILGITDYPSVIFVTNGREIMRYVPDINNRELTKQMQQKFDTLLSNMRF
ncbi:MAG: hypothetical protein SFU91_03550 [Chloroherpetonaceae bacterium]|nr:hypothetical protein [Chloroherpetonaceae bacterium]